MKRLPALIFPLILSGALVVSGCGKKNLDATGLVKLTDRVYAMIAKGPTAVEGLGANSGFVVGDNGVLVIDSRYTPALANELLAAIRSVTSAPVRYVVNTHYHPDHAWGNMVFKAQGAVIVARPETRAALLKYSPAYLEFYKERSADTYELLRDVRITAPDTTFGDETEIDLGGVKVVLRSFGPAHTAGDCVVIVPKARIAFVGGLLSNGYHPNMGDPGADFDNWIAALDRLRASKFAYIVPGQGKVCGGEELATEAKYITTLRNQCEQDIQRMVPLAQAVSSIVMTGAEAYLQPNLLPFNVQAVYRSEMMRVVQPDFALALPEEFQIVEGGGDAKLGFIRWAAALKEGSLEIDTQWKVTSSREVIVQDVAEVVKRYSETGGVDMKIEGSKRIDVGGEKAIASFGSWYSKDAAGLPGSGIWTWALVIRGDKIYSIRLMTDAGGNGKKALENMAYLEQLASTFRIKPRAS
ncbi:MAG: MBL fold metallo-hydrolase [Candidatus Krumholzibacteria bacterium]|nr:MBL fold metallo-hydrolase [Candidatus Krumholzibacteria bacterium]